MLISTSSQATLNYKCFQNSERLSAAKGNKLNGRVMDEMNELSSRENSKRKTNKNIRFFCFSGAMKLFLKPLQNKKDIHISSVSSRYHMKKRMNFVF